MTRTPTILDRLRAGGRLYVEHAASACVVDADGAVWRVVSASALLEALRSPEVREVERDGARVFAAISCVPPPPPRWTPGKERAMQSSRARQTAAIVKAGRRNAVRYDGARVDLPGIGAEVHVLDLAEQLGAPRHRMDQWCNRGVVRRGSPGHILVTDALVSMLEARGASVSVETT